MTCSLPDSMNSNVLLTKSRDPAGTAQLASVASTLVPLRKARKKASIAPVLAPAAVIAAW
jgi:hypothetical protein